MIYMNWLHLQMVQTALCRISNSIANINCQIKWFQWPSEVMFGERDTSSLEFVCQSFHYWLSHCVFIFQIEFLPQSEADRIASANIDHHALLYYRMHSPFASPLSRHAPLYDRSVQVDIMCKSVPSPTLLSDLLSKACLKLLFTTNIYWPTLCGHLPSSVHGSSHGNTIAIAFTYTTVVDD